MQRTIKKGLKVMCREIQMGVAAAQRALNDAGLDPTRRNPERTGVTFGSDYIITMPADYVDAVRNCTDEAGVYHFEKWSDNGLPKIDPLWLLKYLPNMPASHVVIYNDLRGPSNSITLREASANLTVGEAYSTIQRGSADAILAGATGTRVHSIRTLHVMMQEEVAREGDTPPYSPLTWHVAQLSVACAPIIGKSTCALWHESHWSIGRTAGWPGWAWTMRE